MPHPQKSALYYLNGWPLTVQHFVAFLPAALKEKNLWNKHNIRQLTRQLLPNTLIKETLSESQITLLIETLFESPKNIINKMQFDIGRYFQLEKWSIKQSLRKVY